MENRDMNLFDFIVLCSKAVVGLCKWVGLLLLQTIRLGLQYIWIVLPFAILGFVGGWIWAKPYATMFKGNATIVYAEGMRDVVHEGLFDFLNLSNERKCEYGLSLEGISDFDKMYIYNVVDCNTDSVLDFVDRDRIVGMGDTIDAIARDRVHLEIRMLGNSDFKQYEVAMKKFFNSQDYLVQSYNRCKEIQNQRLAYFTKEMARLDSLSSYDYFVGPRYVSLDTEESVTIAKRQDLYYDAMIEVMKHKNYLEMQKMATPDVINFQTPFVVYALPRGYKLAFGLVLGGVLGLLVALAVKYRKVIVAYLKEK
jgi:hypothetical protein